MTQKPQNLTIENPNHLNDLLKHNWGILEITCEELLLEKL